MKILLLILLFTFSVSYGVEVGKIPCDDFKQLEQCIEQSQDLSELNEKCVCPSCLKYAGQIGEEIGAVCDKEYDMSAASCVRLLSWVSKGISVSQCSNYIAFKDFKSCYVKRRREMLKMMLQVTKQEKECEIYKSYEETKEDNWFKKIIKKIF